FSIVPGSIQIDNRKEFDNHKFINFVTLLTGLPPIFVRLRNPQTNGIVEQAHLSIYRRIHTLIKEIKNIGWSKILTYISFIMNLSDSRGVGMQPSKAVY
ncbi:hypothetical protein BB559_006974, partial [Furculomyces boomerangus]